PRPERHRRPGRGGEWRPPAGSARTPAATAAGGVGPRSPFTVILYPRKARHHSRGIMGAEAEVRMAELLIQGGTVVDGSGSAARRADVRVRGGRVVEIGPALAIAGEPCLDASGAIVAPGFIDPHTHLDPALFWDPGCDPLPLHGVTSIVTGNCSLSLAP